MRSKTRFTLLQRALHWMMAPAIMGMLFIGVGMVSSVQPRYLPLMKTHEALGIFILAIAIIRLIVRTRDGAPPLPADLPVAGKLAAIGSHYILYLLMIGMPLLGWGMMSAAGYPVQIGALTLPNILPVSESLHADLWRAHVGFGLAFFALILLHLAAALFHGLIRRDDVLKSMTVGIQDTDT